MNKAFTQLCKLCPVFTEKYCTEHRIEKLPGPRDWVQILQDQIKLARRRLKRGTVKHAAKFINYYRLITKWPLTDEALFECLRLILFILCLFRCSRSRRNLKWIFHMYEPKNEIFTHTRKQCTDLLYVQDITFPSALSNQYSYLSPLHFPLKTHTQTCVAGLPIVTMLLWHYSHLVSQNGS